MALIKCKECNADISSKAKNCPHCGTPVAKRTSFIMWMILVIMIAIIVIWVMNVDINKLVLNTGSKAIAPQATLPANKVNTPPKQNVVATVSTGKENLSQEQKRDDLQLTLDDFNNGMDNYLKTIPQCKLSKLTTYKLSTDGKSSSQKIIINTSKINVITYIAPSKKLTRIRFISQGTAKNNGDLGAMMCATYALLRTLQPNNQTQEEALRSTQHLWTSSKRASFELLYFDDKIKAQYTPFELSVHH